MASVRPSTPPLRLGENEGRALLAAFLLLLSGAFLLPLVDWDSALPIRPPGYRVGEGPEGPA